MKFVNNTPVCPYCNSELEPPVHSFYDVLREFQGEIICPYCHEIVTWRAKYILTFET